MSRSSISVIFELKIESVTLKSINNLGCKSILAHLLFCNRIDDSKGMCELCTRMVYSEEKFSDFLSILEELPLEEILEDCTNEETKHNYTLLKNKIVSLKWFIDGKIINPCIKIPWRKTLGLHCVGANHPILIFNSLITKGSRDFLNSIFYKVMSECPSRIIAKKMTKSITKE